MAYTGWGWGGGGAPPERGTFYRFQVYQRWGFHKLRNMKGHGICHLFICLFKGFLVKVFGTDAPY